MLKEPLYTLETRLWDREWNCCDCRIQEHLGGKLLKDAIRQSVEDYQIHTGIFTLPDFFKTKVAYLTLEVTHEEE